MKLSNMNHEERMEYFKQRGKKNKRNETGMIVLISLFLLSILLVCGYVENVLENYYQKDGIVIYTNEDTNEVAVVTIDCNEWSFFADDVNDYSIDETVRVTFFTNYTTDNIYDDEITNVKKIDK